MAMSDFLKHQKPERLAGYSILLAIILFVAVNIVFATLFRDARIDLTSDRLYTLTTSTKKVLGRIPEPIVVTLYQSQALMDSVPRLRIYADRVEEMLRTYASLSGGKLRYQKIDPTPFSAEEDRAIGQQMRGFMLNSSGEQGYFGLIATNTTDGFERVEFLDPQREENLEYELTSIVDRLSHSDRLKVGVVDGFNLFGSTEQQRPPLAILDMINKNYHLAEVLTPPVNFEGLDVLMIAHPHRLPPAVLYAIDQYALSGKPVLLFMDPLSETSQPSMRNPMMPEFPASDLGPLLQAWGIELADDKVVTDRTMALRVTATSGRQRIIASYLPWLQIKKDNLSTEDVATSQLSILRMSSAGAIRVARNSDLKMTPLITTTPDSMLMPRADVMGRPNPNELIEKFKPAGERLVLAARLSGTVKSAYPDGPPVPDEERAKPILPHLKQSTGQINLVVVADTDMLSNTHVVDQRGSPNSSNGDFVLNLLDSLAGGLDLNGLRGRGLSIRSFTLVEAMEARDEDRYRATERKLTQQLEETQQQLAQLQTQNAPAGADVPVLSREQQDTIGKFNRQIVDIRRQLRDVRAAGRAQIEKLEFQLKLFGIVLVPLLLVLIGLASWMWRRMRLKSHLASLRLNGRAA
jgi:ABC-type uncharacterized transport system involved in gliding motility auxiliary subunit